MVCCLFLSWSVIFPHIVYFIWTDVAEVIMVAIWPIEFLCNVVVNTSRFFPHSWLITGVITRVTWRVALVEQELVTLPEHMSSSPVCSGVGVARSLVFCVVFWRSLSFFRLAIVLSALWFTDSDYPLVSSNSSSLLWGCLSRLLYVHVLTFALIKFYNFTFHSIFPIKIVMCIDPSIL